MDALKKCEGCGDICDPLGDAVEAYKLGNTPIAKDDPLGERRAPTNVIVAQSSCRSHRRSSAPA